MPPIAELLSELTQRYPELDQRLHDDSGQLHRYINIYVNKEEIEDLQGQDTPFAARRRGQSHSGPGPAARLARRSPRHRSGATAATCYYRK